MLNTFFKSTPCLLCSSFSLSKPPLCTHCLRALNSILPSQTIHRFDDLLQFHSLFLWSQSSPLAIPWLLRALKHSRVDDWLVFAERFVERLQMPKDGVLIPSPARVWRTQDHAWCWARALSMVSGLQLSNPLIRVNGLEQKTLDRTSRAAFRVDCISPEWNCSDYRTVVIVDDIVTTGSTARACYRALGRPKNCQVWTLIDRASCDASRPLL